jgi:hypothetical protein
VSSPHTFFFPFSPRFKNLLKATNQSELLSGVFREDLTAGFGDCVLLGRRVQFSTIDID